MTLHSRFFLFALLITTTSVYGQTSFRNLTFSILRNPEPGYYLIEPNASDSIGFVDNSGRSINRHKVGIHSNVQVYNDTYITYFVSTATSEAYFLRRDKNFNVIDTLRPTQGNFVDFHEGKVWTDTSYVVLATETRVMDLSGVVQGGNPAATVIGAVIQERRFSDGAVLFEWKSLDHIPVTDVTDDIKLSDNLIDYIHVNSVWKDTDGNLLVSCRHTDEVIKIKKSTGDVLWRLGGSASKGNQFTFIDDTFNNFTGFSHQHSAIRTKSGNILLFDNGNLRPPPNYARVVEYALDTVAMTATRVWTWQPTMGVIASSQGSVQELDGGNILIGWGSGSDTYIAHEVRRDGTIEAEIRNLSGSGLIPYRVSKTRLGMTGVKKDISSTGMYTFSTSDSTTHVRLSLTRAVDTTRVVVEYHHYAPHNVSFNGEAACGVVPARLTVRANTPENVAGAVIFDVGSIPAVEYPDLINVYHRPIEGQGAFTRVDGMYSEQQQVFTTSKFLSGEFLLSYAECLEPTPVKPLHQAVEVTTTPMLTWTPAVAAESYDVQVSTSAAFSPLMFSQTTANLDVILPTVQESTTLFWRVRKRTGTEVGPWSTPFRFTVVMGVPTLLSPVMEDDTIAVLPTAEFRWVPGIGSPRSRIRITSLASNTVVIDTIIDEPRFVPGNTLRPHTWYSWTVNAWAENVNGRSAKSQTFITSVGIPRLRGPGANVTGVPPYQATFVWDSVAGATSYTVLLRNASDTTIIASYETPTPTVVGRNLPSSTKLTWTCRGNSKYGPGPYAVPTTFTTSASSSLPAPRTTSPRGGVIVDTTSVVLRWSDVYGAKLYDLQYSTSASFTSDVISRFDLATTQVTIGPLRSSTPYYWRVLGRSEFATGTWSDTAVFKTNSPPGKGLIPLSPPIGTIDVAVNGTVAYSTSPVYTSYRVEFSTSPTFQPIVSTFVSTTGECSYQDLERETTYFWRVRGSRDGSPTEVGIASHFTTLRNDVVSVAVESETSTLTSVRSGTSLRISGFGEQGASTVRIVDLQGRLLASAAQLQENSVVLDLSHVSQRQFLFITVMRESGMISTMSLLW